MTKLYFVKTNGYDMAISDNGNTRKVLVESEENPLCDHESSALDYLKSITDDSSWETYEESVEELIADNKILAHILKITAYEIYDAWQDGLSTPISDMKHDEIINSLKEYADGAFDVNLSDAIAEKIAECQKNYTDACNGELEGYKFRECGLNYDHLIKFELQDIEVY